MRLKLVLVSAIAAALSIWLVPAASATYGKSHDRSSATVNVVHGIPGAVVDVCASGDITKGQFAPVITDFEFTQIEKLYLPAGEYDIKVVGTGKDSCASDALPGLELNDAAVPAGANISIVANLTEDGKALALTVGVNDTSKLGKDEARVTAYHTAAAPAVDIWAAARDKSSKAIALYGDFAPALTGLANGSSDSVDVEANRYRLAIAASPSKSAEGAVKKLRAKLKRNKNTIFYAVGSLSGDQPTFTVLKQRIKVEGHRHGKWAAKRDYARDKHNDHKNKSDEKYQHHHSHR